MVRKYGETFIRRSRKVKTGNLKLNLSHKKFIEISLATISEINLDASTQVYLKINPYQGFHGET